MNFISNVLDSIPVVGHVKGIVHYAVGDDEGGKKAMYQSTRTSAVLAGGAAGCLAGPAGAAAGAIYAGMITDGVATAVMDEPQGLIQSCKNIGEDIAAGRNPTGSILSTGIQIGLDGVGGLGMGGVSGAASKVSEKAVAKTIENIGKKVGEEVIEKSVKISAEEMAKLVTKKVSEKAVKQAIQAAAVQAEVVLVSAHIGIKASQRAEEENRVKAEERERVKENERRAREDKDRREKERQAREEKDRREKERQAKEEKDRREKEQRASKGPNHPGSSGPPDDDDEPDSSDDESEPDNEFKKFIKLLKKILNRIYGRRKEPFTEHFEGLSDAQQKYLVKVITVLMKFGSLEAVVELVIRMFKEHLPDDITFVNFLSLLEFVQAHINDEVTLNNMKLRGNQQTQPKMKHKERRAKLIDDVLKQKNIVQQLIDIFKKLRGEIQAENASPNKRLSPDFRDIFSAVSHYFKHRCVPGDPSPRTHLIEPIELTVKQYYDYLRKYLAALKTTPEYTTLMRSRQTLTIQYEVYLAKYGRRFRVVVRGCGTNIVLCSGYVVKIKFPKDKKDGEVFIEIIRKQ